MSGDGYSKQPMPSVVQQILATEPELVTSPYSDEELAAINTSLMALGGEKTASDEDKWEEIVKSAQQLQLTSTFEHPHWEKADPKHRMGELLVHCYEIYKKQKGVKNPHGKNDQGFYKWLDSIPEWERVTMIANEMRSVGTKVLGTPLQRRTLRAGQDVNLRPSVVKAFLKGVAYLDEATRPNFTVDFQGGIARYRGQTFDTWNMRTVFSGRGFAIWVMDLAGTMYAGNHVYGQLHHSSFLAGGEIRGGGELRVSQGKVEFLSGKSGHYTPPIANLVYALRILQYKSVDLSAIHVLVWGIQSPGVTGDPKPTLVNGRTLLADPEKYQSWGQLKAVHKACLESRQYDKFNSL